MNFLALLLAIVLLLALLAISRHHHRSRLEQWRDLIEPTGRDAARAATEQSELDRMMADHAYGEAQRARADFSLARAVQLLELALAVVEEGTPSRLKRLRIMSRLVRMSMAILPLQAVRPSRFRLGRVGMLARAGVVLDAVVVAPAERMAVRLKVLALGFGLTLHVLRASTRAAGSRPETDAPWDRFRAGLDDWYALDEEHLASMRVLLAAIAVELKREEIAHEA